MRKGAYEIKIVRNFSAEEKRKIIERAEKETDTISNQAKRLGIYPSTIWMWIQNYHTFGMDGLRPCPYTKYSEDVKAAAVSFQLIANFHNKGLYFVIYLGVSRFI
jgi:transposase